MLAVVVLCRVDDVPNRDDDRVVFHEKAFVVVEVSSVCGAQRSKCFVAFPHPDPDEVLPPGCLAGVTEVDDPAGKAGARVDKDVVVGEVAVTHHHRWAFWWKVSAEGGDRCPGQFAAEEIFYRR